MKFLFLATLTLISLSLQAGEVFEHIDGQDFYEFFGVGRNAKMTEITASFRKKMVPVHPDRGGDATRAQVITNAYAVLKNRRAQYDLWLGGGASTQSSEASDDDIRKRTLHMMVDEIAKNLAKYDVRSMTVPQLAEVGRITIIYNQRFMPFASLEPNDLSYLINEFTLNQQAYEQWSAATLYTVGYGVIEVLRQYQLGGGRYDGYLHKINELRGLFERIILKFGRHDFLAQVADSLYQYMTGYSYIVHLQNQSSCEQTLETGIPVRDQYGREWIIPIRINVKLGP